MHATVLVDPASEAELDAAEAVEEELFALVGAARRLDRRRARRRLAEARPARVAVGRPRRCELHEEIKRAFDPKGLLNPGKKLARARR